MLSRSGQSLLLANKRSSSHVSGTSAYPSTGDIRAPMSVSDRGLEVNFCWKFSEPIIDRGCFVGLFLRGVARQAIATAAAMVGELGGRALAWKRTPESFGSATVDPNGPQSHPRRTDGTAVWAWVTRSGLERLHYEAARRVIVTPELWCFASTWTKTGNGRVKWRQARAAKSRRVVAMWLPGLCFCL